MLTHLPAQSALFTGIYSSTAVCSGISDIIVFLELASQNNKSGLSLPFLIRTPTAPTVIFSRGPTRLQCQACDVCCGVCADLELSPLPSTRAVRVNTNTYHDRDLLYCSCISCLRGFGFLGPFHHVWNGDDLATDSLWHGDRSKASQPRWSYISSGYSSSHGCRALRLLSYRWRERWGL